MSKAGIEKIPENEGGGFRVVNGKGDTLITGSSREVLEEYVRQVAAQAKEKPRG